MGSPKTTYKWLYFLFGVYILFDGGLPKKKIAMVVPRRGRAGVIDQRRQLRKNGVSGVLGSAARKAKP